MRNLQEGEPVSDYHRNISNPREDARRERDMHEPKTTTRSSRKDVAGAGNFDTCPFHNCSQRIGLDPETIYLHFQRHADESSVWFCELPDPDDTTRRCPAVFDLRRSDYDQEISRHYRHLDDPNSETDLDASEELRIDEMIADAEAFMKDNKHKLQLVANVGTTSDDYASIPVGNPYSATNESEDSSLENLDDFPKDRSPPPLNSKQFNEKRSKDDPDTVSSPAKRTKVAYKDLS